MSERKTIQINPELFKVSEKNTSRKNKPLSDIKIKSPEKKQKQKTLRKNVLKMIREKQQEEYKRLFEKSTPKKSEIGSSEKEFNKDFDESLDFFSSLASKPENVEHNTTFKKYPEMDSVLLQPKVPIFIDTNEFVSNDFHEPFHMNNQLPPIQLQSTPKYGCLKNGSLPTYKTLFRQTQKINPQLNIQQYQPPSFINVSSNKEEPLNFVSQNNEIRETINAKTMREPIEITQKYEKAQKMFNDKSQKRIKYLKRKKIFKRTYHVGRSTTKPQIGILVSNRTIRNRISTDSQLLKQTPIQEVRKFLIKKGFIKVGTSAPNDVLRKMYESVSLVCGEIQNHNPENLLFNFIHDTAQ